MSLHSRNIFDFYRTTESTAFKAATKARAQTKRMHKSQNASAGQAVTSVELKKIYGLKKCSVVLKRLTEKSMSETVSAIQNDDTVTSEEVVNELVHATVGMQALSLKSSASASADSAENRIAPREFEAETKSTEFLPSSDQSPNLDSTCGSTNDDAVICKEVVKEMVHEATAGIQALSLKSSAGASGNSAENRSAFGHSSAAKYDRSMIANHEHEIPELNLNYSGSTEEMEPNKENRSLPNLIPVFRKTAAIAADLNRILEMARKAKETLNQKI